MSKGVLWLWIVLWKAAYCEFVRCSVVFIQKHSSSIILLKFLTTKHGPEKQNTAINNGHHSLTSSASKSKGHRGLSSLYLIPWPINTKYIYLNRLTLKYNIYHIFFKCQNVAVDDRHAIPFHNDYIIPLSRYQVLFTGKSTIYGPRYQRLAYVF